MSHREEDRKRLLVRQLVEAGRGAELRLMTLGASKYCRPENDERVIFPQLEQADDWPAASFAYFHLEFTARYGTEVLEAKEGSRWRFAYPKEFEIWLSQGAPGLFLEELEAYVAENPL